ncbi:MAG: transposase, partial [Deltaproteobacteria bacterium]|nr:transposase [Deltaproteobacteria bacterium]
RPPLATRFPVHVTLKARQDAPRLRQKRSGAVLRAAMAAGCDNQTFRLCHFSIQPGHVHLICEAKDTVSLSRGGPDGLVERGVPGPCAGFATSGSSRGSMPTRRLQAA